MIAIRKLTECSLDQAVQVWNEGFSGYLVDMTTDPEAFMTRQAYEQLSPRHSVVAFDGERPVGFVLNGIRTVGGRKISWNGGTGIIPAYRGQGVGRKLIEVSLGIYAKEGVDTATIEAFASNAPAIALYESEGYVTRDTLLVLRKAGGEADAGVQGGRGDGRLTLGVERIGAASRYTLRHGTARDAGLLTFYPALGAWQAHWASLTAGESLIAFENGKPAGYALYKRVYGASGNFAGVTLYQCEASPENGDPESVLRTLLEAVLDGHGGASFSASHIASSRTDLLRLLEERGFQTVHELFWMTRDMTEEGRA
ncbi:N-acetyltransferase family protein [Paenibacillus sp. 1P03SA]|uniref:GNAT family N-acetyltransferase n=1 Tax=Paenibacillus sp. 1P03SA TaxID=3132294 RepID=UPI0039A295DE